MQRNGGRPNGGTVFFPTLPGDTFQQAPCHQEGPDLWESTRDHETQRAARVRWREAAELCGYCPALDACARLADAQDSLDGVWAGRVPRERRESAAECGTASGYNRHRREGEVACGPCKAAHSRRALERKRGLV